MGTLLASSSVVTNVENTDTVPSIADPHFGQEATGTQVTTPILDSPTTSEMELNQVNFNQL